jgi:AcrR family transcriptional regulator
MSMTQRVQFTREMIVEAAFALTREEGWAAVTARTIAKKLGSSTMPIYSSLRSMEDIENEVREKAEKLMHEFQQKRYTEDPPLNMAEGYVRFAKEEPHLFRFLFLDRPLRQPPGTSEHEVAGAYERISAGTTAIPLAQQVPVAMQDPRILKNWIFTHGLAAMISSGVLDLPVERIRSILSEAGGAFFLFAEQIKRRSQTSSGRAENLASTGGIE